MKREKTLVIGNSGSGKTTCVNLLAADKFKASMDDSLSVKTYPGIDRTLQWVLEETSGEPILASSTHEDFYWDLARLRKGRSLQLQRILVIYLYTSIPQIRHERLKDSGRPISAWSASPTWDSMINDLGRLAADISINTDFMTTADVATLVLALSQTVT